MVNSQKVWDNKLLKRLNLNYPKFLLQLRFVSCVKHLVQEEFSFPSFKRNSTPMVIQMVCSAKNVFRKRESRIRRFVLFLKKSLNWLCVMFLPTLLTTFLYYFWLCIGFATIVKLVVMIGSVLSVGLCKGVHAQ